MGQYTKNGLLNGYKKNNKERAENDYYATPTAEVKNILDILGYDFSEKTILEPCVGGGHMMNGIINYCQDNNFKGIHFIGTDIKDRGYVGKNCNLIYDLDFLHDEYPIEKADIVIMNPPYATLEPFLIRALEIAQDKLIVLCRTQAVEGSGRWDNVYAADPPTDIYQYIDRIQCWKNGEQPTGSSAQAYCWLVWDREKKNSPTIFHWMHRVSD